MKKGLFILLSAIAFLYGNAQIAIHDTLDNGIGQINLGDPFSKHKANLLPSNGGTQTINGKKRVIYSYTPFQADPLIIAGVTFRLAMLTFDQTDTSNILSFFSVSKLYRPKEGYPNPKDARADYKKILTYLESAFNEKGTANTYYDKSFGSLKGYEWRRNNVLVKFNIQEDTRTEIKFISLDFDQNK